MNLRVLAPLIGSAALLLVSLPGKAESLYVLKTACSLNGTTLVPCTVEAIDEGKATIYRHTVGTVIRDVRITDKPVPRIEIWNDTSKGWESAVSVAVRFSKNAICFNGVELCAINPNYLNSILQDNPDNFGGRDLVRVHFGRDGRIDASCYDAGCELINGKG
jgi:hypothetical protein